MKAGNETRPPYRWRAKAWGLDGHFFFRNKPTKHVRVQPIMVYTNARYTELSWRHVSGEPWSVSDFGTLYDLQRITKDQQP